MRVLLCSNDETFNPSLAHAYHDRGHEIIVGTGNLALKRADFDIVHFHWPEELVGFGVNTADESRTRRALELIDWWSSRSLLISTVHNLVPHATEMLDGPEAEYFKSFYERMDIIGHFSHYSRAKFTEVYPTVPRDKQIVHSLNLFDHLAPFSVGRQRAREELGLSPQDPVFCVFGALRKPEELGLLWNAWNALGSGRATLIFAARPPWEYAGLRRRLVGELRHRLWLRRNKITLVSGGIDDRKLVRIVEASNAVIIPRFGNHLNSGLLPLALTLGTGVIAPDFGVFRETLPTPANELYAPNDAAALARAIARQAEKPVTGVRAANLEACASMGWANILESIWSRVTVAGVAKRVGAFQGMPV